MALPRHRKVVRRLADADWPYRIRYDTAQADGLVRFLLPYSGGWFDAVNQEPWEPRVPGATWQADRFDSEGVQGQKVYLNSSGEAAGTGGYVGGTQFGAREPANLNGASNWGIFWRMSAPTVSGGTNTFGRIYERANGGAGSGGFSLLVTGNNTGDRREMGVWIDGDVGSGATFYTPSAASGVGIRSYAICRQSTADVRWYDNGVQAAQDTCNAMGASGNSFPALGCRGDNGNANLLNTPIFYFALKSLEEAYWAASRSLDARLWHEHPYDVLAPRRSPLISLPGRAPAVADNPIAMLL